jgi:hypothetical protein
LATPGLDPLDVIAEETTQRIACPGPSEAKSAEMGHVEDPG